MSVGGGPLRLAVVGKGGAGKSTICATIARVLARRGRRVFVLDHDSAPGLSLSLGLKGADEPLLNAAMQQGEDRRYRFVEGLHPVAAARRFAIDGPDGVRVLQVGKSSRAGVDAVQPSVNAFYEIVRHLEHAPQFSGWQILATCRPAGVSQAADGRPTQSSSSSSRGDHAVALTARRIRKIVEDIRPGARVSLLVSKATRTSDVDHVREFLGMPAFGVVPYDDEVERAERIGVPVIEQAPASRAVAAITEIALRLDEEAGRGETGA